MLPCLFSTGVDNPRTIPKKQSSETISVSASLTYGSKTTKSMEDPHHLSHVFKLQQRKPEGLLGETRLAVKLEAIIYWVRTIDDKSLQHKLFKQQETFNSLNPNQPDFIHSSLHLFHPNNHFNQDFRSLLASKFTHFSPSFQPRPRCLWRWHRGLRIIRGWDGNFFVHAGGNFGNQQHLEKRRHLVNLLLKTTLGVQKLLLKWSFQQKYMCFYSGLNIPTNYPHTHVKNKTLCFFPTRKQPLRPIQAQKQRNST